MTGTPSAPIFVPWDWTVARRRKAERGQGGSLSVNRKGGLQEAGVREEICRVMEGGRQAFEKRFKKIVFTILGSRS